MRRRTYLKQGSLISTILMMGSVAGCSQTGQSDKADNSGEVGDVSLPEPEVVHTTIPELQLFSVEKTDGAYTGTVINKGKAGRALVNMYWTNAQVPSDISNSKEKLTFAAQQQLTLNSGETATVSFEKTIPEEYSDVWMIVSAGSVTTTLKNHGESGDVVVMLYEDGTKHREKTVSLDGGEQKNITITKDIVTQQSELGVRVSVQTQ